MPSSPQRVSVRTVTGAVTSKSLLQTLSPRRQVEQSTSCNRHSTNGVSAQHRARAVLEDSIQPLKKGEDTETGDMQGSLTVTPTPADTIGQAPAFQTGAEVAQMSSPAQPPIPSQTPETLFLGTMGKGVGSGYGGLISKRASSQLLGPLSTRKPSNPGQQMMQKSLAICRAHSPAVRSPSRSRWVAGARGELCKGPGSTSSLPPPSTP